MTRKVDITGRKRGSLTATSCTGVKSNNGDFKWNFLCECGNTHVMSLGNFGSKPFPCCKVCGRERLSKASRTHGFKQSHKTYKAWCKMKERCFNINCHDYKTYGARGITVDTYFMEFLNFYNEVGEAPTDGQMWSIDRIDHTKNYEPGNVRWATDAQQARNKGKMETNSSGVTGVIWDNKIHPNGKRHTLYASAQWYSYTNGKRKNNRRAFSTSTYGLLPAFYLACEYRMKMIEELNAQGAGYASNHGQ
jgi:hypothetical protein